MPFPTSLILEVPERFRLPDRLIQQVRWTMNVQQWGERRASVMWFYIHGFTHQQIGAFLNMAPGTVHSHIRAGNRDLGLRRTSDGGDGLSVAALRALCGQVPKIPLRHGADIVVDEQPARRLPIDVFLTGPLFEPPSDELMG